MFSKLRNRFLLMNMIIISIIMLASFTTIYIITYQNVHRDISDQLQRMSELYHLENSGPRKPSLGTSDHIGDELHPLPAVPNDNPTAPGISMEERRKPPELSVSFAIHTDPEWNIVEEAFQRQKQFIADASHELKTPLAVIHTNADVLLAHKDSTIAEQSKWLHHIKAETERMKTLTNDLLYLTRMEEDHGQALFVPFDLSEAVESVVLTMEPIIYEKRLSLTYHIEPGHIVTGSSEQIKQVVMILLDNAIKYTNAQGEIHLTLTRQNNRSLFKVTNTGEGIPAESITKIFDRFYRADTSRSRKSGGYGLGLAIAKSIVERHKGKIYAKSIPQADTSFYVQLG